MKMALSTCLTTSRCCRSLDRAVVRKMSNIAWAIVGQALAVKSVHGGDSFETGKTY